MLGARFRSLYHAIRAGIQIVPDAAPPDRFFGVSPATGRLGCDALAAAWLAEFYDQDRSAGGEESLKEFLSINLADVYPVLRFDMGESCPAGPTSSCPHEERIRPLLEQKIIHLQDCHGFTREQVADWLQTQGL